MPLRYHLANLQVDRSVWFHRPSRILAYSPISFSISWFSEDTPSAFTPAVLRAFSLRLLDGDSASTPSLGRRVWTEAQVLTTMLVRYRQRASWAFLLFLYSHLYVMGSWLEAYASIPSGMGSINSSCP